MQRKNHIHIQIETRFTRDYIYWVEGSFAENVQNRQYANFVQCIFISRGSDLSYAAEICETGFK